jgi:hypothetical protein
VTERPDARDGQLQTAVYECLNSLVAAATEADLAHVDSLVACVAAAGTGANATMTVF